MSMKKLFKTLILSAAVAGTALSASFAAFAEDVKVDVSEAKESTGWGQSITIKKEQFDARRLSKKSLVKVAYDSADYAGEEQPVELIFQSWDNTTSPNADETGAVWARVAPDEWTAAAATFSYDKIVEAYGTDDFSQVMAICVGDTDVTPITVKAVEITECAKDMGMNDVVIDCSAAKECSHFGQSLIVKYDVFDSTIMTKESEIVVKYTTDAEDESALEKPPVSLIMQSWENSNSPYARDDGSAWLTVDPAEYKDGRAVFKYQDMVDAYGTADFSKVSALNFSDNGEASLKVEAVTVLNCVSADKGTHVATEEDASSENDSSAADDSSAVESVAESQADSSTADSTAAATTDDNKDDKGGSNVAFIVIGIVAGVVLAVVVLFIILTKQSSQEYDIDKRRMVSKKKPKNKAKW